MEPISWKNLFAPAGPRALPVGVRVFARGGHPLVVVPIYLRAPADALFALYAPQTSFARTAKALWQLSFPLGFAPGSYRDEIRIDSASDFVRFLVSVSGENASNSVDQPIPGFAILVGNPHAPAPRFLVQVFDRSGKPTAVVKTGVGPAAAGLIKREADFLVSATPDPRNRLPAIPAILGRFADAHLNAFAMPFVAGASPSTRPEPGAIPRVLGMWSNRGKKQRVSDLAAWKRLSEAGKSDRTLEQLNSRLGSLEVHPPLFHGDFAPWNIKVSPADKHWTVLDWERGELEGPPGWDWFHYVIQSAMLVEKQTGSTLAQAAESLLACEHLRAYLATAGLEGCERDWLQAYLLHCRYVLKPKEGSPGIESLLAYFSRGSRPAS
jgi:hypothetical protein